MATVKFETGLQGPKGDAGTTLLFGAGAPGGGLGVDLDSYIDTVSRDVYHREGGAWVLKFNLAAVGSLVPNQPNPDENFRRLIGFGLILNYLPVRNKDDASLIHKVYVAGSGNDLYWAFGPGQAIGDLAP